MGVHVLHNLQVTEGLQQSYPLAYFNVYFADADSLAVALLKKIPDILAMASAISVKTGINYPDLEAGNEFWNRVWLPSSCYKSLVQ